MPKKKPGFTLDEHKAAGEKIKRARDLLNDVSVSISRAYPKSSRAGKANGVLFKTLDAFRTIKHELDEQVARDFPDLTPREFGPIYYGPSK
ncbi:hypothetical protein [Pseudodesulfovibrio karagichevae]|uniref:Uncharacterized protein n=1 Tax=Pseudodesulfovibrio karagichevae TaxID=3239305 RepID=A0ABV4K263_9BACT